MNSMNHRCSRVTVSALCAVAVLISAPGPGLAQQDECFDFKLPLLFDTSNNGAASYENPRVLQIKEFAWNGHPNIMYNRGNELTTLGISDPLSPQANGTSLFIVPPAGDRDQNLMNYAICDDCRYGMAGFEIMGTVLFDLGTGARPRIVDSRYYSNIGNVGALAFDHGGQEYLLINGFPGGCGYTAGLYRFNGVDTADLQLVECVNAGSNILRAVGGHYLPGSPAHLYVVDVSQLGHIYEVNDGPPVSLTYLGSPFRARMNWDQGLAVDTDVGLAATARIGFIQLWDISAPASPVQLVEMQPNPAARYSSAAIKYPYLWVAERGMRETLMYDIRDPSSPQRMATDFWEYQGPDAKPWNTYPYSDNRHAHFHFNDQTYGGDWLFVARFSVLERFEVLGCLDTSLFSDGFESGDTSAWSFVSP